MIELTRDGALWNVTLNRPEKANSLTADMLSKLIDITDEAASEAKVLVLTGAGKVFSAGADLDEARAGLATSPLWEALSGKIASLPCLTIAALNGTLAGGAFGMALACDIRLSDPGAKFFYPVMKLGFLPQPSDPKRMAALIGSARAKPSSDPPTMKVSVPPSAAAIPPETGASTATRPFSRAASATARAVSTSMVEQSISSAPSSAWANRLS